MIRGSKKKIILGVVLVGTIALTGLQAAGAAPAGPGSSGPGPQHGQLYKQNCRSLDPAAIAARNKFLDATTSIRREMAVKRAERRAMMASSIPNARQVGKLSGELFDLREQLRAKARESGLGALGLRGMMHSMMGMGGRCGKESGPGRNFHGSR
ncbi:MAG: hypothetical protein GWP11_05780 [Proteobacteria bacterium]|nr:hypothetical protein [Pseudomonadota bacterium]